MRAKFEIFFLLAVLMLACLPANANVPTPPATPPVPGGYCSTINTELQGYLDSFNQTLGNPAPYPTLQIAQLQMADSNVGPALTGPNYLASVMVQVQELQAMGFQGIKVEVGFPVLYEPFFGSQAAVQPYQDFYQHLAQNIKALGLKLLVEDNVSLATGDEAGWPNLPAYYNSLSWDAFIAARAAMAGTVAQLMQPDFLMLSEEPDNEAVNAGQPNLNNPVLAAAMIAGEITTARLGSPLSKLGAGFGTWMGPYSGGLMDYLNAYVALPLDYIDMHIYPIATEYNGLANFLQNALIIANTAAAALKPVAISESWAWKMENSEFNVVSPDTFRARNPFGFWGPIDTYFIQTMQKLANYTQMLYLTTQGNVYFQATQTYGGTTSNGGAANCTCTTATCSNGDITSTQNTLADTAGNLATFTSTGLFYSNLLGSILLPQPDSTAPSAPSGLTGTAGYNSATIAWVGSTDNVGVAGYNILRCTGASCTPTVWIANAASSPYVDMGLTDNTTYNYQVQAFDVANNVSASSNLLTLTTPLNTPPNAPENLTAKAISPKQITLTWSAPTSSSGLSQYLISSGLAANTMVQVASMPSTKTTYQSQNLSASTNYCYEVVAVEKTLNSPPSNIACATTMLLPNAPSSVTATATSSTKMTLKWVEQSQPNSLPVANYQVNQGTTPGVLLKIATTNQLTYNVTGLLPNTTYYYSITAVDTSFDNSTPSDPVSGKTLPLPNAPTNLTVSTLSATKYKLSWNWTQTNPGLAAARYLVYCGTSPTGQPQVGTVTAMNYTNTTATAGATYYCNVVAVDTANDNSLPSANLQFVMPPMPNAPNGVIATPNTSTKVTVNWTQTIPNGGLSVTSYKIYRSNTLPVTLSNYVATRTTPSYIDTTVSTGKTYYYAISAIDSGADASPLCDPPGQATTP